MPPLSKLRCNALILVLYWTQCRPLILVESKVKMSEGIQPTEHPYIVRHPGIGSGEPIIKETRIAVRLIAGYYKRGAAVEEIERDYSFLSAAAIYDAISYYLDHQDEIEDLIESNRIENVLRKTGLTMDSHGVIDLARAAEKV